MPITPKTGSLFHADSHRGDRQRRVARLTLPVSRPRAGSEAVHLLVDSTGLKLCGPGEWLVEKHAAKGASVLEKAPYRGGRRHGRDH